MRALVLVLLLFLFSSVVIAQIDQPYERKPPEILPSVSSLQQGEGRVLSLKKPGHYTVKDWQHLIDSVWGQGLTTAQKLSVFDRYWDLVDQTWGGFPNLYVNWDSLKSAYRPLVAAGVSRGRFYGILCRLTRALCEWHVFTIDRGIDNSWGSDFINDLEYPNYQSFHYQPGIPLIDIDALFFRTDFGAGLTFLPDSTALVYSVMPNHPLSLQPGDVILGYDGIPWKQSIKELLDAELPILNGGNHLGPTSAAAEHRAIMSVGNNWGLFDTIDVVKYSTNDTLHYPTSLLGTVNPPYFVATEQLPVKGVPFPDIQNNKLVSWGVIQGTSIGYVYAWDWRGVPAGQTRVLFGQAIDELIHQRKVQGLILDYRTNWGYNEDYAYDGYKQIFNFDPTLNNSQANRVRGGAHLAFWLGPVLFEQPFEPGSALFDRPIAVLTGPLCGSAGDYNAFRMRFHAMVRFFGKPTAGAYTSFTNQTWYRTLTDPYFCRVDDASLYSNYNNEGYLIHKPFPVDEEVWLTQDGVAKGEDDVVKRALQWIATVSYGHDVTLAKNSGKPNQDTIKVSATIENPQKHMLSVWSYLNLKDSTGVLVDSCQMYDDGLHNDGVADDKVYGGRIRPPTKESAFGVSLRTTDLTAGTFRYLPNARVLFTNGPVVYRGWRPVRGDTVVRPGNSLLLRILVSNEGKFDTVRNVSVTASTLDTMADIATVDQLSYYDVAPGQESVATGVQTLSIQPYCPPNTKVRLLLSISSYGIPVWTDTMSILVQASVTEVADNKMVPTEYSLSQNYPNPFNPSTTVRYELPKAANVSLKIYNTLGQLLATLVDERKAAGSYQVQWNASNVPSGIYFYRLQAGEFVETKKMVVLK